MTRLKAKCQKYETGLTTNVVQQDPNTVSKLVFHAKSTSAVIAGRSKHRVGEQNAHVLHCLIKISGVLFVWFGFCCF